MKKNDSKEPLEFRKTFTHLSLRKSEDIGEIIDLKRRCTNKIESNIEFLNKDNPLNKYNFIKKMMQKKDQKNIIRHIEANKRKKTNIDSVTDNSIFLSALMSTSKKSNVGNFLNLNNVIQSVNTNNTKSPENTQRSKGRNKSLSNLGSTNALPSNNEVVNGNKIENNLFRNNKKLSTSNDIFKSINNLNSERADSNLNLDSKQTIRNSIKEKSKKSLMNITKLNNDEKNNFKINENNTSCQLIPIKKEFSQTNIKQIIAPSKSSLNILEKKNNIFSQILDKKSKVNDEKEKEKENENDIKKSSVTSYNFRRKTSDFVRPSTQLSAKKPNESIMNRTGSSFGRSLRFDSPIKIRPSTVYSSFYHKNSNVSVVSSKSSLKENTLFTGLIKESLDEANYIKNDIRAQSSRIKSKNYTLAVQKLKEMKDRIKTNQEMEDEQKRNEDLVDYKKTKLKKMLEYLNVFGLPVSKKRRIDKLASKVNNSVIYNNRINITDKFDLGFEREDLFYNLKKITKEVTVGDTMSAVKNNYFKFARAINNVSKKKEEMYCKIKNVFDNRNKPNVYKKFL